LVSVVTISSSVGTTK
jgi:hypothetical protein